VGGGVMGWDDALNEMVLVTAAQPNPPPTLPNGNAVSTTLATWVWSGTDWVRQMRANGGSLGASAYDPISQSLLNVGYQNGSNYLATYRWDGTTWTKLGGSHGSFNPPVGASLVPSVALDPALGRLVFLSPSYSQGPGAAAWSWNGKIWTTLAASGWPGSAEVLVTDADHGQLLLIGSPTPNNDAAIHVWTLRGSTWQQLDTSGAGG
jgi:hypothetical protein